MTLPPEEAGFREIGRRLSNWGRWGAHDELGTLNLIGPEHRAAGAALVRTGESFSLALPLDARGPQRPEGARQNPIHMMTRAPRAEADGGGLQWFDDALFLYSQAATHVDALAQVAYDGRLYNGVPVAEVGDAGARRLGVETIGGRIQGRGVLLDLARLAGRRLDGGERIGVAELEAAEAEQGVRVGPGDLVLIRTAWLTVVTVDGDRETFHAQEPGLDLGTAAWLHERGAAFVASDNWGIEASPAPAGDEMPLHGVLIRDMGMPLGEMFDLEAIADHAADRRTWEFQLSCPILPITGGIGSPAAPVVTF